MQKAYLLWLLVPVTAAAQLPAFPGAEGFGACAKGGRGGDVYHVISLADNGNGSLRFGIETADGPRTIVFDISGTIELASGLDISTSFLTLAGQSAPVPGILIQNYGLAVNADHVILRHLRIRPGDAYIGPREKGGFTEDALTLSGRHIIADHISTSWAVDEDLSCGAIWDSVTIQYCLIAEALHITHYYHGAYAPDHRGHSMGSLIKARGFDAHASLHHNIWAMNNNRNPAVGSYEDTEYVQVDVRSNVMYNCGTFGYSSGASRRIDMNYIGNYIIAGPYTSRRNRSRAFEANRPNNMFIYQSENKIDSNVDQQLDGIDTGWTMIDGDYTVNKKPFLMPPVNTLNADKTYTLLLASAGAYPWQRDSVDRRVIEEIIGQKGKIIDSQVEVGGYEKLSVIFRTTDWDTDQDGMPDWWEDKQGLSKRDPADRNSDTNQDGYTNLEEYLNYLCESRAEF